VRAPRLSLGVDIVDLADFSRTLARSGPGFVAEAFTPGEARRGGERGPSHLAACWAVKEAFVKAAGSGLGVKFGWRDVEVVSGGGGPPRLVLRGSARAWAGGALAGEPAVSFSCSGSAAVAVVILHRLDAGS